MTPISPAGQSRLELAAPWQRELRDAVKDVAELAGLLGMPPGALPDAPPGRAPFPLLVPRGFVARMRRNDSDDPLLRQVLPLPAESDDVDGFTADPLGEAAIARSGLLRKYAGRALLIASAACPVHCRYCFRREFPYSEQLAARRQFGPAIAALREAPDVTEIILSGGDPLSLGNAKLGALVAALAELPQIQTLRIHTRYPIMIPSRVDDGFLGVLADSRLKTVVVVHANHPNEIDESVGEALQRLKATADAVLNQSVLLRGVNDTVETLERLSRRLFDCGVLPYYLHLLDPVTGAAHLGVGEMDGVRIVDRLRDRLPGYLVPKLVREVPGELSKTPILAPASERCDLGTIVPETRC